MLKQPRTIGIDDLLKQVSLEERIYRHRCVEAWAMTVPWTGFPLSQLLKIAEPLGSAKYVVFETTQDKVMPGLDTPFYPWPYVEGVTIDEAGNDLAFISTGLYGKPLPPQNGGPIRLTLPWKYGFKSAKAIVKITFTDKRPTTFWEAIGPSEYGFWANVNPAVPHPRWSQATERLLGSDERVPNTAFLMAMLSRSLRYTLTARTRSCSCDCSTRPGRDLRRPAGRRRRHRDVRAGKHIPRPGTLPSRS